MTIYIKLTNKVHVPYITPAPCVKATPQVLGKKSQPRAQDHIVLYRGLVVRFLSLVFLSLLRG